MLDFSLPELIVIIALAVLLIGPKDIPNIMRSAGRAVRRLQYVRYAFSQQFEDFMKEQDMDDLRQVNFEEGRRKGDEEEKEEDNRQSP